MIVIIRIEIRPKIFILSEDVSFFIYTVDIMRGIIYKKVVTSLSA